MNTPDTKVCKYCNAWTNVMGHETTCLGGRHETTPDTEKKKTVQERMMDAVERPSAYVNHESWTPDIEWEEEAWQYKMNRIMKQCKDVEPGTFIDMEDLITNLLSSRDTYWKERVRNEVEKAKVCIHCKGKGTTDCPHCEPDTHECSDCGGTGKRYSIDFEALDTLLDNLK